MLLVRLLIIYLIWLIVASCLQRYVLFPRQLARVDPTAANHVVGLVKLTIETEQGSVEGWFIPGEGVSEQLPGPVVFFAHGNAETMDLFVPIAQRYVDLGVSVMLVEYRGYGRSAGSPSQKKITSDYLQFYDLIAARSDVDKDRIVYHGRSVGAGVICALARERKPAAMILQSPFTSVKRMAGRFLVPPILVWDPFDNVDVMRSYDGPVLIVHGAHDEIIPVSHGRKLAGVAKNAKIIEYDCGHNDFPMMSRSFWDDIDAFLRETNILRP